VLEHVDQLALSVPLVAFYGWNEVDMHDTIGPLSKTVYAYHERPTKVSGVAVDPAFARQYHRLRSIDATAVLTANLTRDANEWTALIETTPAQLMMWFFPICYYVIVLFGIYLLFKPVLSLLITQGTAPKLLSFQPHLAAVMGCLALYALLSWAIFFPYKARGPVPLVVYRLGLIASDVAFCLMVLRWTLIVSQVRPHALYKVLRYVALFAIAVNTIGTTVVTILDLGLFVETMPLFAQTFVDYGATPPLILMALLFMVLALQLMVLVYKRTLPVSRNTRKSMQRARFLFWC
jgi:hypothetical protein